METLQRVSDTNLAKIGELLQLQAVSCTQGQREAWRAIELEAITSLLGDGVHITKKGEAYLEGFGYLFQQLGLSGVEYQNGA